VVAKPVNKQIVEWQYFSLLSSGRSTLEIVIDAKQTQSTPRPFNSARKTFRIACSDRAIITPYLTPEQRPVVLAVALAAARTIGEERARSNALIALAPYLGTEQLAEVLAAVMIIADEYPRSKARYTRILQILA
jgi:hypothetical protein